MIGTFEVSADQAGRITVPLALRRRLGDDLVICPSMPPERHLLVYEASAFDAFRARLFPHEPVTQDALSLMRNTVARAQEVRLDKAGRVLVPPRLRTWAGVEEAVVVLGMGDHLEVWSAASYEAWAEMMDSEEAALRFTTLREEMERANRAAAGSGS